MRNTTISKNYDCNYTLKFNDNYVFSICGKCINLRTSRVINKVVKGYTIGYLIDRKFYSLTFLRQNLVKIKTKLPF